MILLLILLLSWFFLLARPFRHDTWGEITARDVEKLICSLLIFKYNEEVLLSFWLNI